MFLILTETATGEEGGDSDQKQPETEPEAARGEPKAARKDVNLTDDQSNTAIDYLQERPFMWYTRPGEYKVMKKERDLAWKDLAKILGLSCEYHFFLFIIVSDGDVPTLN